MGRHAAPQGAMSAQTQYDEGRGASSRWMVGKITEEIYGAAASMGCYGLRLSCHRKWPI
jgi:hypothetical protein